MNTLGLPRAMSYYYMYPFFSAFCKAIGVELVVSSPTSKKTMDNLEFCPTDEPCVAVKLLFAHAKELLDRGVDRLLIPCLISLEPKNFCCPKFIGIPYMVQNALGSRARVFSPQIDLYHGKNEWHRSFFELGEELGVSRKTVTKALSSAWQAQRDYEDYCVSQKATTEKAYRSLLGTGCGRNLSRVVDPATTDHPDVGVVAVIGHPYIIYDAISLDLLNKVTGYARVVTAEMVDQAETRRQMDSLLEGERLWSFEAQILGAALYYIRNRLVDKVILVGSFECGPESVIENYIEEEAERAGIPFILLTLDEHTAEAGIVTRIEAFMDVQPIKPIDSAPSVSPVFVPGPRRELMVLGMPTMGYLDVAIRSALTQCGVHTIKTPHAGKEVIELGKALAPEFVCLPFTITLGQMRWLLDHGATHLMMVGGKGKCRLGWYAQMQEQLLRRLGYDFEMIIIDSPLPFGERWASFRDTLKHTTKQASWLKILRSLYFGYHKMAAIDKAESICHRVRAFEVKMGTVDRAFRQFVRRIERASSTESVWHLAHEFAEHAEAIETLDTDPVRVRIVGEIWVVLESHVNLHLEEMLGKSLEPRVWVDREISATSWFHQHLFPNREANARKNQIKQAAGPYLGADPGGHGHKSVGLTALAKQEQMDGVIHLFPFTCMPEIVAQNIMIRLGEELDLPILTFIITDQTGEAGFETRVEAFLDILRDRRDVQEGTTVSRLHLA